MFNGNLKVEVDKVTDFDENSNFIVTLKSTSSLKGFEKIVSADFYISYKTELEINIQMKNWSIQK